MIAELIVMLSGKVDFLPNAKEYALYVRID